MDDECDKCAEHPLECVCDDESLTTCSEFPRGLAASIIKRNLEETQMILICEQLKEIDMLAEFIRFCKSNEAKDIFQSFRDFAKLHPDKFYVPDEIEPYNKFGIRS